MTADILQQKYRSSAAKLYTSNDMNQEKNVEAINSGEIIVANTLPGRSTDIKTNNIEEYGGLHVFVTFIPSMNMLKNKHLVELHDKVNEVQVKKY